MSAYPTKPSVVATLEQEIVRLLMAYQEVNPKTSLLEDVNTSEAVGQWFVRQTPNGDTVFIGRATIILQRSSLSSAAKPWMAATETPGGAAVPTGYTSN